MYSTLKKAKIKRPCDQFVLLHLQVRGGAQLVRAARRHRRAVHQDGRATVHQHGRAVHQLGRAEPSRGVRVCGVHVGSGDGGVAAWGLQQAS